MRHATTTAFLLLGLLVAAPSTAVPQTPARDIPYAGLARWLAGIDVFPHPFMPLGRVAVSACPATKAAANVVYARRFN
jgi:hypothetical protein